MSSSPETSQKHLLSLANRRYDVAITKQGSKFTHFKLIKSSINDSGNEELNLTYENIIILDSIHSGTGRNADNDIANNIFIPVLNVLNFNCKYYKTESPNYISDVFIKDILSSFASGSHITILIISGDTSISELINGIAKSSTSKLEKLTLNLIPIALGTANALANSIKLACPIDTFKKFIHSKLQAVPLPLYKAVFPSDDSIIFFIIVSLGFHANLLHLTNKPHYQSMGIERFQLAADTILHSYHLSNRVTLTTSRPKHTLISNESFAYFTLIAMPNLEMKYIPSPNSDPTKSQLHVLAYSDSLNTDTLQSRILQGYHNMTGSKYGDLVANQDGTVYNEINNDCEINVLDIDEVNEPDYKTEICLDGLLFNLTEFEPVSPERRNTILVKFINSVVGNNCHINIMMEQN